MSWLFSRALVEEFLVENSWDGEPYVPSSVTGIAQVSFCRGSWTPASDNLSRYGLTCELLTVAHGEALLTWFRAVFPARPSAAHLEDGLWLTISGRKHSGSWQMLLPGLSSPRTSRKQRSTSPQTRLNRWVSKSIAWSFPRKTWVQTTYGSGTGFVHTPTHTANYAAPSMQKWPNCREFVRVFGKPSPTNHEWLMGWPIGWTASKPLETAKFRSWLQQHGAS